MKDSPVIFHEKATEGKVPHLLEEPNLDAPSLRKVAVR
ncbi:MAG: hypothetical protein BWX77_00137 [Bacteroidetes bacterium ADurb.Bin090]|nr:MAG: hypothetical protein BWX77_00137 [Bacteroidetes bacterium ADurb.Bin090]